MSYTETAFVSGKFPMSTTQLMLDGQSFSLEDVNPLSEPFARHLKVSPFGDLHSGTTTVDKAVRDATEITNAVAQCTLVPNQSNSDLFESLHKVFGQGITVEFDKLNVYGKGGHFATHVDTPSPGVVGSLVVVLPVSDCIGGELVVKHSGQKIVFKATDDCNFAAFFASCEHEVRPVKSGTRVSLAFKIKLAPNHSPAVLTPSQTTEIDLFVKRLRLAARKTGDGIVGVFMTHNYSLGAASREQLVGLDRALFAAIKLRFPKTKLTSVMTLASYSRWEDDQDGDVRFSNIVFQTSRSEIERLGALGGPKLRNWYNDENISGIPFIRARGLVGTELKSRNTLGDDPMAPSYGNEIGYCSGECVYMHAALIIDTNSDEVGDDEKEQEEDDEDDSDDSDADADADSDEY